MRLYKSKTQTEPEIIYFKSPNNNCKSLKVTLTLNLQANTMIESILCGNN